MRKPIIALTAVGALLLGVGLLLPAGRLGDLKNGAVIVYNGPRHPPTQSRVYKETATRGLEMHVFQPGQAVGVSGATVVLFHGGGFHSGWPDELFPLATELAKAGHSVFVPAYRLQRADRVVYPQQLEDCRDAVAWVVRHAADYGADPQKLVIGGSSAGAHLAAAVVTLPREDGQAFPDALGLILSAPYLDSADASANFERTSPNAGPIARWLLGEPVDVFEGRSPDYSPRGHLHASMPPALVMAGERDRLWPPGREFCDAMREIGRACRAKAYPNAGHAFALAGFENFRPMVSDVLAALDRWLAEPGLSAARHMIENETARQ